MTKSTYNFRMATVCTFTGLMILGIAVAQLILGSMFVSGYKELYENDGFSLLGAQGDTLCPGKSSQWYAIFERRAALAIIYGYNAFWIIPCACIAGFVLVVSIICRL